MYMTAIKGLGQLTHKMRELLCADLRVNQCYEMRIGRLCLLHRSISSVEGYI